MNKTRLEAFSDGVLAIIITIMVLEIKIPHEANLEALSAMLPVFTSYILSFVFIAIYWANHHHLLHTIKKVTSRIIWANMLLLFTLSLIPFSTGWMGENHYAKIPVAFYSINLFLCGFSAFVLQNAITYKLLPDDKVFMVIKHGMKKTIFSIAAYIIAIISAFYYPIISLVLISTIAVVWVIPDRNIEKLFE